MRESAVVSIYTSALACLCCSAITPPNCSLVQCGCDDTLLSFFAIGETFFSQDHVGVEAKYSFTEITVTPKIEKTMTTLVSGRSVVA